MSAPNFVGRTAELAAIAAIVAEAAAGRARVIWIEGAAGSGKTALVRRAVEHLPAEFGIRRAEADEMTTDVPLAVAGQLARLSATDGFAAGLELLEAFADAQDDGPLAVVVEDLHWADAASLDALLTAARRLHDDRVVMLVTTRSATAFGDGWERFASDAERCLRLRLVPLTVEEVEELAEATGLRLSQAAAERLCRHTQGHPLYVRTLLAELTPEQLNAPDGGLPAPRTLASTTTARMAEVSADAQRLGSAMAVVNQRVALDVVARVGSVRQPTEALESLLTTRFVEWSPNEIGTPVGFAHPLYRTAIYDDLSPTRRQELHRAAATVLEGDAALAHRVAATDHVDEALAADLIAAARGQAERGAFASAARNHLSAALFTADPRQADAEVLAATHGLLADGQITQAVALRPRIEAADDSPARRLALGMLAAEQAEATDAERWLRDVPTIAAADGSESELAAEALAQLGTMYTNQNRGADAIDVATRALALHPADREIEHRAWTSLALGEGMVHGAPAGLDRLAPRLPADARDVKIEDSPLLITRGILGFYAGHTTASIADVRFALRFMTRGSDPTRLTRAHLQLSLLYVNSGEWDDGLVHAHVAASLAADEREIWLHAQIHSVLGVLLASRGEWSAAEREVLTARDAAVAMGTVEAVFTARIAEGALARARAIPGGVVEALGPLAGNGDSSAMPMVSSLGWWATLIHALVEVGDLDGAERHIAQLDTAAEVRRLQFGGRVAGMRARLAAARGDAEEARQAFERAVNQLGPDDPVLERAIVRQSFGRLLHAVGRRRDAVLHLRVAHELLSAAGARPYLERVEDDLQACGIGSRTAAGDQGTALSLTERESDVVALVMKGMTNREVAAELYVSAKAVEYHLRNVYGKLGISSRRELRAGATG